MGLHARLGRYGTDLVKRTGVIGSSTHASMFLYVHWQLLAFLGIVQLGP